MKFLGFGFIFLTLAVRAGAAQDLLKGDILTEQCRAGGEGPKPIHDISGAFPANVRPIPTEGQVREFLVWEKRNRIIYRNAQNQIRITNDTGSLKFYIAVSSKPLSRVTDEGERYLLIDRDTWFFDVFAQRPWIHFQVSIPSPRHLFWSGNYLYTLQATEDNYQTQRLYLYRYRAGDGRAKQICPLLKFTAGEGFRIGQGHSYPEAVLYRTRPAGGGKERLTVGLLNVETCQVKASTYQDPLAGPVQNVHWFADLKSALIEVDHPVKRLVWDNGSDAEHCHYYTIGSRRPMVLNHKQSLIATFDPNEGLTLLWLHDRHNNPPRTAQLLQGMPIANLDPQDVRLSEDGRTLFAAPEFNFSKRSKQLIKIEMPEPFH